MYYLINIFTKDIDTIKILFLQCVFPQKAESNKLKNIHIFYNLKYKYAFFFQVFAFIQTMNDIIWTVVNR